MKSQLNHPFITTKSLEKWLTVPCLDLGVADDAVSTAELAETRRVGEESCMALGRALMAMSVSVCYGMWVAPPAIRAMWDGIGISIGS